MFCSVIVFEVRYTTEEICCVFLFQDDTLSGTAMFHIKYPPSYKCDVDLSDVSAIEENTLLAIEENTL